MWVLRCIGQYIAYVTFGKVTRTLILLQYDADEKANTDVFAVISIHKIDLHDKNKKGLPSEAYR